MATLPQYPEFPVTEDPDISSKWEEWLDGFEAMLSAMKCSKEKEMRGMLKFYIGASGRKVMKRLDGTGADDDAEGYTKLRTALNKHFTRTLNRVYGMNILHQVHQRQGESIDNFAIRVKERVATIEMEKLSRNQIIELITLAHMVNNCNDKHVKHKAIRDDLDLSNFMACARASERAEQQLKEMENATESSVNRVQGNGNKYRSDGKNSKSHRQQHQPETPDVTHPQKRRGKKCFRCGDAFPHSGECPAKNAICNKCHNVGHYAKVCHTKNVSNKVNNVENDTSSEDEYISIPCISTVRSNNKTKWAKVKLHGVMIETMIDSGSEINIIDENTFNTLPVKIGDLEDVQQSFCGYGPTSQRKELNMLGKFSVSIKCPTTMKKTVSEVHVLEGKANNLLGCMTSEKLGLIQFTNQVNEVDIFDKYKERFMGIGKMKNTTVHLNINKDVKPVIQKARRIPFHYRDKVESEMENLKSLDIIEEADGPTEWQSPIVISPKANGQIRVCLDSRAMNTAIERERYPMPTIEELIVELNGAKHFSKIDLNKGYHQLELAEDSRHITTFSTHNKVYRYKRLCFGINSAAEIFQKAVADMLHGIKGQINISDDIIIFSKTKEEHASTLDKVLMRLEEYNVTANREKCEFWKKRIRFFGHVFSGNGIEPCEDKIEAIVQASEPKSPEEVRSLLGMVQYLSRFIPNYSSIVEPLRILTKKDTPWTWSEDQVKSFENLKTSLSNWKMLSYFDVNLRTELIVDASPIGLGAMLTQRYQDEKRIIEYASRKLSPCEQRYSQTEREALGVVWGCEHFEHYLIGAEFTVITDHQPLIGILGKPASKPTARLHRLCLRLQPFKMKIEYQPGEDNPVDYLSRHPMLKDGPEKETLLDSTLGLICINAIKHYQSDSDAITLQELEEETARDEALQDIIKCIANKQWQNLNYDLNSDLQSFKNVKDELSVVDGLILRDERIVIPEKLRERAVNIAHGSHQGIVRTKALIRETIWFPGIDRMVENKVRNCIECQACTPGGHREPMKMTKMPDSPWKEVSMDFIGPFPGGEYMMVVMDDYSRFPEIEIVYSTSSQSTLPKLDAIFARQGIPEVVKTDNGPPFNGEPFAAWAKYVGFHHRKITPRWPEANGEAERFMRTLNKAVQTAQVGKGSWKQEIWKFLRHYRATPHSTTGLSPCELLNGRKLRTEIPVITKKKKTAQFEKKVIVAERRDERLKTYMKEMADERNNAKACELKIGDQVLVKQDKHNKLTPLFEPNPYTVIDRDHSMITAQSPHKTVVRNASHFKVLEPVPLGTGQPSSSSTPVAPPAHPINDRPQRSSVAKQMPNRFSDFQC